MMDAPGLNAWHADVANSPACARIFQRALGLPPQVVSNSLLTGAGLAEVAAALAVAPGQILVDLVCGRGGYGREVARQTGARLAGLDFSAVAVTIAAYGGPRSRARFCVGDFAAPEVRAIALTRSCASTPSSSATRPWRPYGSAGGSWPA
jgi:hypothetical protein